MTDQERINENLQRQIDAQNARIDNTLTKIDMMMQAVHEIRADMRQLQSRQDAASAKHEEDMREMNKKIDDKFDKLSDQIHTMTIAAVVGFGAIVAAVGGLVFTASK
ncbi:MAG: hypothetical protein IKO05_09010 [Selenomonadaceae bacterium]|nr:hypothetical protein [Selenomonadaceae bacterium]